MRTHIFTNLFPGIKNTFFIFPPLNIQLTEGRKTLLIIQSSHFLRFQANRFIGQYCSSFGFCSHVWKSFFFFQGTMDKIIFVSHCQPQKKPKKTTNHKPKNLTLLCDFSFKGFKTISENISICIQPQLPEELHFIYSGLYIAIYLYSGTS